MGKNTISSGNDIVKSSKLGEILDLLEVSEWDSIKMKMIKKNLQQLLYTKQFQKFQEKIGINQNLCDGILGQSTLNSLVSYIVGIDDCAEGTGKEAAKYVFNILSGSSKTEPDFIKKAKEKYKEQQGLSKNSIIKEIPNLPNQTFYGLDILDIFSYPTVKNEETQSYCCSKTARINGKRFGVNLPRGDAYQAGILPTKGTILTLPKDEVNKKPSSTWGGLSIHDFNQVDYDSNFADIYASSMTGYGHRAVAFRTSLGNWFVLDPYIKINGKLTNSPIPLEKYILKGRKIVKAHFYHSSGYSKEQ